MGHPYTRPEELTLIGSETRESAQDRSGASLTATMAHPNARGVDSRWNSVKWLQDAEGRSQQAVRRRSTDTSLQPVAFSWPALLDPHDGSSLLPGASRGNQPVDSCALRQHGPGSGFPTRPCRMCFPGGASGLLTLPLAAHQPLPTTIKPTFSALRGHPLQRPSK
jgi:hypothetical protein